MSDNSANSKRIAKNTLMLYFRQILTMAVSLYTSRVVLQAIGVEDFGIYNVVGGLVGMFAILSNSLSSAISRFITYELGKGNKDQLKTIFSTSLNVQIMMSVIIVVILELIGVWFLNNKLDIPPDRLDAAGAVLHISMLTFLVNLISVPYNASIIAHEKMSAFAYVSLLEVFLKLGVVYLLNIAIFDKLVVYAWLLFGVALIIRMVYSIYCRKHFEECKYQFVLNKPLLKEMFSFAGWNFIGSSSIVLKNQGINIILNIFFGPVVNAARGIAMQVNTAINSFVQNFMTAVNPQITKSYASGDYEYMMKLVFKSSRLSFYLMLMLALPIIIEAPQILSIWLVTVPDYTIIFVRLILLDTLINTLSQSLVTAQLATGNIKMYQIVVGGINMLNLPLAYLVLVLGFPPESVIVTTIAISCTNLCARLYILRGIIKLPSRLFVKKVVLNVIAVSLISYIFPSIMCNVISAHLIRVIIVGVCSLLSVISTVYLIGLDKEERVFVENKIVEFMKRK